MYEENWNSKMFNNLYNVKVGKWWSFDLDLFWEFNFLFIVVYLVDGVYNFGFLVYAIEFWLVCILGGEMCWILEVER